MNSSSLYFIQFLKLENIPNHNVTKVIQNHVLLKSYYSDESYSSY